jgi:hypothetical protein
LSNLFGDEFVPEPVGFAQPVSQRRFDLVAVRHVNDVDQFRRRLLLHAANQRRSNVTAEKDANLQVAPARPHEEVAGIPREHDRRAGRVNPLLAELDGGVAQPLPRVTQFLRQICRQRGLGGRPAVVRLAWFDPRFAVITLAAGHWRIVSRRAR